MGEHDKKSSATILMLVGILFIVVSGGIFVSSSWQYIPDVLKRCFLVVLTAGFFLCSGFVEKKWGLARTSQGLYYLGVAFSGFAAYAFLWYFDIEVWAKVLAAQCVMSLPVLYRFVTRRKILDGIFQMILLDGMAVSMALLLQEYGGEIIAMTASLVTVLNALVLRSYVENGKEQRGAGTAAAVVYTLHLIYAGLFSFGMTFSDVNLFFRLVPVLLLLLSATILYGAYRTEAFRMAQGVFIHYACFAFAMAIARALGDNVSVELVSSFWWIWFILSLAASFLLKRKEMFLTVMAVTMVCCGIHLIDMRWAKDPEIGFPYALAMAAAVLVWEIYVGFGMEKKTVGKIAALWGLMFLNHCLATMPAEAFRVPYLQDYACAVHWALIFMVVAYLREKFYRDSGIFKTLALATLLRALINEPVIHTVIRTEEGELIINLTTEYVCVMIGLSIALLGKIWYHKSKGIRLFQFVAACLLLAVLLMRNLDAENIFNVLFLAVAALAMLVVATMRGSRRYSIASAVTLVLLVLYLTRNIWTNIAWWVYLFVAGVGLVVYAVKREKADKK